MVLLRFLADLSFVILLIFCCLLVSFIIARIVWAPAEREERRREAKELTTKVKEEPEFIPIAEPLPTDVLNVKETRKKLKEYPITPKTVAPVPVQLKKSAPRSSVDIYYILCVLTAEGGCEQKTCNLVAQALYNACEKYHWQYSPVEIIRRYQYAAPLNWNSKEAKIAYQNVFENGIRFPEIGNATIFYAPAYCSSAYHESQIFVYEYNGVRYFEERN